MDHPETVKKALRAEMRKRRREALTPKERKEASASMAVRLWAEEWFCRARRVMAYVSLPEEVQTSEILSRCLDEGKRLFLPAHLSDEAKPGAMEAVEVCRADLSQLSGVWYRPPRPKAEPPEDLDCILVPGVAFTERGERLGMGGGFYDRFLLRASRARRVALSFECQIVEELPTEAHDLGMDVIVTERRVIPIIRREERA